MGGPFYRVIDRHDQYLWRRWFTQPRPWTSPLPFSVRGVSGFSYECLGYNCPSSLKMANVLTLYLPPSGFFSEDSVFVKDLFNRSYDRLKQAVSEQAELGITIAQHQQAIDMIRDRSLALYRGFKDLKRGRNPWARKKPLRAKNVAGRILETQYGWVPLYSDIYAACEVLSQNISANLVRGRASGRQLFVINAGNGGINETTRRETYDYYVRVNQQFRYIVQNPNLALAQRLGLVNPLTVAWDGIPFSFLVDQFVNVGQVLAQYTDFLGVELIDAQSSIAWEVRIRQVVRNSNDTSPYYRSETTSGTAYQFDRYLGIRGPSLIVKPLRTPSPLRALNNIALLGSFLKSI